jgi:hypothetical protein
MDHNGAFTADENVDTAHRRRGGQSRVGEDGMLVAEGGVEIHMEEQAEDSPLLGRRESVEENDAQADPGQTWAASTEWDHLPWWKRPSVRSLHMHLNLYGTNRTSSPSGSSSHSSSPPSPSEVSLCPK